MKSKTSRYTTWLLSGLCAFAAMSCSSDEDNIIVDPAPDTVNVSYSQTQCADQWGQAEGTGQLVAVATAYLTQRNLTLYRPQAVTGPAAAGFGCNTPTGLVLKGAVSPADLPSVLSMGFVKE